MEHTVSDMDIDEKSEGLRQVDLVGGPFAVIESDPGVFTSLTRRLGIQNVELVELYDIEPWVVDHLSPHGLIFCFLWRKDSHHPADFEDPAAERVWFANQLSDDACATHAILNVVLNCPNIDIGEYLAEFKKETAKMSPVMKGLAMTNSPVLREAHNSLARPADLRGALSAIALTTLEAEQAKLKEQAKERQNAKRGTKPYSKRAKTTRNATTKSDGKGKAHAAEDIGDAYHFVGYVPAYGKVWELDGLKSGPLEVGELPSFFESSASSLEPCQDHPSTSTSGWMDVARPALRMKMEKYGGSAEGGNNIQFSLLAIVDGLYEKASDELELLKREKIAIERRLGVGWDQNMDSALLDSAQYAFSVHGKGGSELGPTYAKNFGARKMERDLQVLDMPERQLLVAWEASLQNAIKAKVVVEDELSKAVRANTDHVKRTFDYEPFFKEYVQSLHTEGLLDVLLDQDDTRRTRRTKARVKTTVANGKQ